MILIENGSPGTYSFFIEGGTFTSVAIATTWTGNTILNYIDEVNTVVRATAWASNSSNLSTNISLPSGNYSLIVPTGSAGVSITLNRIPS